MRFSCQFVLDWEQVLIPHPHFISGPFVLGTSVPCSNCSKMAPMCTCVVSVAHLPSAATSGLSDFRMFVIGCLLMDFGMLTAWVTALTITRALTGC